MKRVLAAFAFAVSFAAVAQPPPAAPDVAWPREVKAADGTVITVYQPQLERWADNRLSARAAVSVRPQGAAEPHYGVIELSARTRCLPMGRATPSTAAAPRPPIPGTAW